MILSWSVFNCIASMCIGQDYTKNKLGLRNVNCHAGGCIFILSSGTRPAWGCHGSGPSISIWHHSHTDPCKQKGWCSPIRIMCILAVVNSMPLSAIPKLPRHSKTSQWNFRRYKQASTSLFTPNPNLKRTLRYRASPEKDRARRFSQFWWAIWSPKMPPTHPRGNFAGGHGLDQR